MKRGARQENAKLVTKCQHHKKVLVDLPCAAAAVVARNTIPRAEPRAAALFLCLL
jgi:hypothetical protein